MEEALDLSPDRILNEYLYIYIMLFNPKTSNKRCLLVAGIANQKIKTDV